MAVPTFHALYAAGFFEAASPSASPLPWPSSAAPGLGAQLVSFRRGDHDAAGFASCCGPLACTFPAGRLDPALRRPGLPKRRRATTKVTWFLLWPDFHRLAIVNFQDARSTVHPVGGPTIRQAGEVYRKNPGSCNSRRQNLDIPPNTTSKPVRFPS